MTVLVLGAFDLLHWGHLRFLNRAGLFGRIHVGLSTDAYLAATKRVPAVPYVDRSMALQELGHVVHPRDGADAQPLVRKVRPSLFACGADWIGTGHLDDSGLTREFLGLHDVAVVYVPRHHAMSTTRILGGINGH